MRIKAGYVLVAVLTVVLSVVGVSCRKVQTLNVGGVLKFSVDTLKFDTVFTAEGSFTRGMLIFNPQDQEITISSVRMQQGTNSYFHLTVDGASGVNVTNIKIAPHDSVYVYATVNINPNDSLSPFFVVDSLIATLNGSNFYLPLTAYGQNAHYVVSDSFIADTTWLTDKPYVVIHNCIVGQHATVNIPRGCRVYMHQDARFVVYGAMNVGEQPSASPDSVVFQGDRLDRVYFGYQGYPGEWCGFWFAYPGSVGNITHSVIKNCGGNSAYYAYFTQPAAVRVDSGSTLNMDHTIIENSIGFGIFSWQGTTNVSNCLVATTGAEALAIIQGGYDSITNCTFANYGGVGLTHASNGTVTIVNYFNNGDGTWEPGYLNGVMRNCIVYGSLDSEIVCDSLGGAGAVFRLDHCLLKMGNVRESFVQFTSCIFNQDPMFKDENNGDFHLTSGSPAIGAGNPAYTPADDLEGKIRDGSDLGCYGYH